MKKHKGQIVEQKIKDSGIKVNKVAKSMGVSRGTLYNHFKRANLDNETLIKIGKAIKYDFAIDFPELIPLKDAEDQQSIDQYGSRTTDELVEIQRKYYKTLEKQNLLLRFLARTASQYELEELKKEVEKFTKKHLEED